MKSFFSAERSEMKEQLRKKSIFVRVLEKGVLVVLGLTIALGLVEMLMRAFPNLVPSEVSVNPPVRRVKALIDETYDLRQSDGDLNYYMRGKIMPLSPEQDQVVAHVHMITDAHGFRNSPPEKDTYSIVALGDSFTRASGVASPWPQKLADEFPGNDVLNLGEVGFGPQGELQVLRQYGMQKQPQLVILAYFEGNDLYDAASYEQANPFILFRFGRYLLNQSLEAWSERGTAEAPEVAPDYTYPITITIDRKEVEMVFFSYYVSWLSVNRESIKASQNYRLVRETILQMRELSEAQGTRFLLVYVPSKEHVYLPYLNDADVRASVFSDVPTIELDEAGFLKFTTEKATPELTNQHMDDQALLLADFAAEHNIQYLDLTPIFQEEAGTGADLYYAYDTHWNQLGHNLAAETIYNFTKELLADTPSKTAGH